MPRAARVCNKLGCPEITTDQTGYCEEHKRPAWQGSTRNKKNPPGWARIKAHVMHRDQRTCVYCGQPATDIDHVIPISRGGGHTPNNLVASCSPCNQAKNLQERNQSPNT